MENHVWGAQWHRHIWLSVTLKVNVNGIRILKPFIFYFVGNHIRLLLQALSDLTLSELEKSRPSSLTYWVVGGRYICIHLQRSYIYIYQSGYRIREFGAGLVLRCPSGLSCWCYKFEPLYEPFREVSLLRILLVDKRSNHDFMGITVKFLISARAATNFRRALDPAAIGCRRLSEVYN